MCWCVSEHVLERWNTETDKQESDKGNQTDKQTDKDREREKRKAKYLHHFAHVLVAGNGILPKMQTFIESQRLPKTTQRYEHCSQFTLKSNIFAISSITVWMPSPNTMQSMTSQIQKKNHKEWKTHQWTPIFFLEHHFFLFLLNTHVPDTSFTPHSPSLPPPPPSWKQKKT